MPFCEKVELEDVYFVEKQTCCEKVELKRVCFGTKKIEALTYFHFP